MSATRIIVIAVSQKEDKPMGWARAIVPTSENQWGDIQGMKFDKTKFGNIIQYPGLYEIESETHGEFGQAFVSYHVVSAKFIKTLEDMVS